MDFIKGFSSELQYEAATTRKCLERIPPETFDFKPHEKSMTMSRLATHVAEMYGWVSDTIEKPEIDFATMDYKPSHPQTTAELVEFFDGKFAGAVKSLENASPEAMRENWRLRNGEEIYFEMMRLQVLRGFVFNHIIHHRGQLSVYLRMNDIPVPALYGPSADEGTM